MTPLARVAGRSVTTLDGLPDADAWCASFAAHGATQCGFCTPGIIMRVAALTPAQRAAPATVDRALAAHLCRCTGWVGIAEAVASYPDVAAVPDPIAGARRAELEGGTPQTVGADVARGASAFADDTAPTDALVAVLGVDGSWVVAEDLIEARRASGKVQGRRSTVPDAWPIALPDGDWVRTLQTTWVEPGYLEPDAAWAEPDGASCGPLANGGAFGGKRDSEVEAAARRLASEHGRPVRVVYAREDTVRRGPKRPPVAAGIRADGTGVLRIARTPGIVEAVAAAAPGLVIDEVDVIGPSTSAAIRGAGWAEAAVLRASLGDAPDSVTQPGGGTATATIDADGAVHVRVDAGDPLEPIVLRSYVIGAAHMALGWVRHESIGLDADGVPVDLTMRSFGILKSSSTPTITVEIVESNDPPRPVSDAAFAAVAAAAWRTAGFPPRWPLGADR